MFDIANHRAWEDLKALLLHRENRERRERGLPTLEEEIAQEERRFAEYCDPQPRPMIVSFGT
jgi:hypothetical protein